MKFDQFLPPHRYNSDCVLYWGDCMDLFQELEDQSIQLIVSSPPYNLGKSYEQFQSLESYVEFQKKVLTECVRVLSPTGSLCWEVGNYIPKDRDGILPLDYVFYPLLNSMGLQLRNRIIWHFGHGLHASKRFSGRYETILWFTKSKDYIFHLDPVRVPSKYPQKKSYKGEKKGTLSGNPLGKNPSDVWEIPNVKSNHIEKLNHPCQYPVELVERLVLSMTNPKDIVFDPYMGTGTTAIASLMHGRTFIGSEICEEYYHLAKQRLDLAYSTGIYIRPMNRPVFDPKNPSLYVPPKKIQLGKEKFENS